jgi:hypothetical protein
MSWLKKTVWLKRTYAADLESIENVRVRFGHVWGAHRKQQAMFLASQRVADGAVTLWMKGPRGLAQYFSEFSSAKERELPPSATFLCGDVDDFLAEFSFERSSE